MKQRLALASLILAGCVTAGPYSDFAKAGRTYATALDTALDKAANVRVDATSEMLLRLSLDRKLTNEIFEARTARDRRYVRGVQALRDHAKLLAGYFDALEALADSNAPADAGSAAKNAFDALKDAGVKMPGRGAASAVTKLAVSGIRNAKLRDELNEHGAALRDEVAAEQQLIAELRRELAEELTVIDKEEPRRLAETAVNNVPAAPEEWIAARRALLRSSDSVVELDAAAAALDKLAAAYDKLVQGQLAPVTMRTIAHDIEVKLKGAAS